MPIQNEELELFEAFRNHNLEGVKKALKEGAWIENNATRYDFMTIVDNPSQNTLSLAIAHGTSYEIFKYLFERGAKVYHQRDRGYFDNDRKYSSMHHLLERNLDLEIIKLFLENGAKIIPQSQKKAGWSESEITNGSLGYAIRRNCDSKTIEFLLEQNTNVDKADTDYVKMAIGNLNPEVLKLLLRYDFAIDNNPEKIVVMPSQYSDSSETWIRKFRNDSNSGNFFGSERLGDVSNSLGFAIELKYSRWTNNLYPRRSENEEDFNRKQEEVIDILLMHNANPENLSDLHSQKKKIMHKAMLNNVTEVSETLFELSQADKIKLPNERGVIGKVMEYLFTNPEIPDEDFRKAVNKGYNLAIGSKNSENQTKPSTEISSNQIEAISTLAGKEQGDLLQKPSNWKDRQNERKKIREEAIAKSEAERNSR